MCLFHLLEAEGGAVMRVAGGLPGNIVAFPWQVSLQGNGVHGCGGSIISSQWVLSAAHCTFKRNVTTIRVGSSWHGAFGKVINISRIVDHPKYSKKTKFDYDFTLIKLSQPLIFDKRIQPIDLPDEDTIIADGTLCKSTGWGKTENSNKSEDFLRKVEVPIVNQDECNKVYPSQITPQMICAGYFGEKGRKDTCRGDSGGPLRCFHTKNGTKTLLLVGVVSWGYEDCGGSTIPGVYARVTSVRKWIESVTGI